MQLESISVPVAIYPVPLTMLVLPHALWACVDHSVEHL